tara:strand:- start:15649 stop:16266 length:618 start_codon:yes stop_codon:yes gene_type:complete
MVFSSQKALQLLEEHSKIRDYKKGEYIYREGEIAKGMYWVQEGLVGLIATSSKGNDHLLRLFKPGKYFGHRSLLAEEPYHANARCIADTSLRFVPKEPIKELFVKHNDLLFEVTHTLAKELREAEMQRVSIADDDVLSRVAGAILVLKDLYPEHRWTRSEIATFIASTTATVIRSLGELEKRGYIAQESRAFEILDRQALVELGA